MVTPLTFGCTFGVHALHINGIKHPSVSPILKYLSASS